MSLIAMSLSALSLLVIMAILYRNEKDYASRRDLEKLRDHVTTEVGRLQYSISQIYRYVEAVDAHTGANGHKVLSQAVRGDNSSA